MLSYFKFHHIGVATKSIEQTAAIYTNAGYTITEPVVDTIQDIRICFLSKDGMPTVELLEPVDEKSPVNDILKKNGTTPYHCCYAVENIDQAIKDLKAQHYVPVSKSVPAVAFGNERVCFLYHKYVGLIELVEQK